VKTSRILLSWFLLAVVVLVPACGKKGPPLAPLLLAPAPISDLAARRIGDTVYLKFTIPSANASGTRPADLARVDIFAFTALSPYDVLDVRDMTRIASIAVRRPPEPEPEPKVEKPLKPGEAPKPAGDEKPPKPPEPPKPPKPREPGEDQGALYTVTETLTPSMQTLTIGVRNPKKPKVKWFETVTTLLDEPPVALPLAGVVPKAQPTRFYVAMGVSRRGVKGVLSPFIGVSLQLQPPGVPAAPALTVTEKAIGLVWEPPAGAPEAPYAVPRPFTELDALGIANASTAVAAGNLGIAAAVPATVAAAAAKLATAMAAAAAALPPAPVAAAKPTSGAATPPTPTSGAATPPTPPGAKPAGAVASGAPAPLARIAPPPPPLAGTPRGMMQPVLLGYNVYLSGVLVPPPPPPAPGAAPPAPVPVSLGTPAPIPLNPAPLPTPAFQDTTFVFDTERCYEIRAVNALGVAAVHAAKTLPVPGAPALPPAPPPVGGPPRPPVIVLPPVWFESAPTAKTCVTPKDVFPPPVPTSLAAVGSVGAINLIWEGVEAPDLAGYILLRGTAPDGPMTPLFDAPISQTTYRDTTVTPGVRYVYTVVAVDTATPPNRSLPSGKAEETAR